MITIQAERPQDGPAIEALLDAAFGPGRERKTVYRLRRGVPPVVELCLTLRRETALLATIRFWPILAGGAQGLLLGPLAVVPGTRGRGHGGRLIRHALDVARGHGHGFVLLVGEAEYYRRFGFAGAMAARFRLPGPVERNRFLGLELRPGALPMGGPVTARSRLRAA